MDSVRTVLMQSVSSALAAVPDAAGGVDVGAGAAPVAAEWDTGVSGRAE
jgi:hypothetical protein